MQSLNKTLSLSLPQHRRGSKTDTFTSATPMVFGLDRLSPSMATFVLVVIVPRFDSGTSFSLHFSKVSEI